MSTTNNQTKTTTETQRPRPDGSADLPRALPDFPSPPTTDPLPPKTSVQANPK